jgi:hypothetical protein
MESHFAAVEFQKDSKSKGLVILLLMIFEITVESNIDEVVT